MMNSEPKRQTTKLSHDIKYGEEDNVLMHGNAESMERGGGIIHQNTVNRSNATKFLKAVGLLVFGLFPFISVIVLFVLVSQIHPTTENYYSTTASTSEASFPFVETTNKLILQSTASDIPLPVSVNSYGNIQRGGGTSVRSTVSDLVNTGCPLYLDVDSVFNKVYIVSSLNKDSSTATMNVIEASSLTQTTTLSTQTFNFNLFEVTTLNPTSGLFVFITQDFSDSQDTSVVIAGRVDDTTYDITLGTSSPAIYSSATYSVDPAITRLSDTTFAIVYYTFEPFNIYTVYGQVDSETLEITLSESALVVSESLYIIDTAVGLTDTSYFIMYYNQSITSSSTPGFNVTGPLTTVLASFDIGGNIIISTPVVLENSKVSSYLSAVRISDNSAVVSFADAQADYGIRSVVVSLQASLGANQDRKDYKIFYGSSLLVTTGQSLTTLPSGLIMEIDSTTIFTDYSNGHGSGTGGASLAVLFSDILNDGAMTTAILQVSSSGSLFRASPNFVLNKGNPDFAYTYSWGGIATGSAIGMYGAQILAMSLLSDPSCTSSTLSSYLSVIEILPSPIGVISSSTLLSQTASTLPVMLTGTISGFSNLELGKAYYTTTQGELIAGKDYFGHGDMSCNSDLADCIVTSDDGTTMVSKNSYLGLAVAKDTILLKN